MAEKIGSPSGGQTIFSKTEIQLSADGLVSFHVSCLACGDSALESTGSMVGLTAISKRAHAKGRLPGLLLPVSLFPWQATASPHLRRRASNTHR